MGNKGSKEAHKSTKGETRVLDVEVEVIDIGVGEVIERERGAVGKLSAEDKKAFVETWKKHHNNDRTKRSI